MQRNTTGQNKNFSGGHFTMIKELLEGLVQSHVNAKIDMSKKSGDTYNIDKIEIKIDVHITNPVLEETTTINEQIETQEPEHSEQ